MLLATIIPIADAFLCLNQHLSYKNLIGLNILFGNFLVMPCLLIMSLVILLQTEEQNDTLKNILLTGVSKWKILLIKISAAFIIAFMFIVLIWGIGIICGFLVGGSLYPIKGFIAMFSSGIAVIFASSPILIIVIIAKKKFSVVSYYFKLFIDSKLSFYMAINNAKWAKCVFADLYCYENHISISDSRVFSRTSIRYGYSILSGINWVDDFIFYYWFIDRNKYVHL